jgi:hypothetical protein
MEMTKMIGGLVGPTLVALGVAILINSGNVSALAEGVSRDPALILMSGMLSFIAGLAIVRAHNRWIWSWPVIVTVVGWLLIVGGLVRFLFPMWLARVAQGMTPNTGVIVAEAIIFLLAGGFLSFKAYGRE